MKIRVFGITVLCAVFAGLFLGCDPASMSTVRPGAASRQPPPHIQTNVFGQLEGWKPVAFDSRPAVSLTQHSFAQEGGDADPDISPDGKWIVFSSLRHAPNPDLYIKRVAGVTVTQLTSDPASEMQPAFSPQGDKIAYATNRSGSWDIWVVGVDGTDPVRMTDSTSHEIHPSWSPDGKMLVFCNFGQRSQQWELWVVQVDNPSVKRMIGYGLNPVWSPNPDVPKIAYQVARYRGSNWFSIWTIDYIDGDARFPTEIVTNVNHACICPDFSPDASMLVYSTVDRSYYEKVDDTGGPRVSGEAVYMVNLNGLNNLRLTHEDASHFAPSWGPDERVYFCSDRKGIDNIWSLRPHRIDFARDKPVDLTQHPLNGFQAN